MLSLRDHGMSIVAIGQQYNTPRCTLYYWISRYDEYQTYENRPSTPHRIHRKVTEDVKTDVIDKHRKNPRLGSWRLSQFEYVDQKLSRTTIWRVLVEARQTRLPLQFHYHLGIETSTQLELFDLSRLQLRYVSRRPPNQKHPLGKGTQLWIGNLG